MILSSLFLLKRSPNPNEEEIKRGIDGNLCCCRCTGYLNSTKVVHAASKKIR